VQIDQRAEYPIGSSRVPVGLTATQRSGQIAGYLCFSSRIGLPKP
jgi:hypothetical protein